MWKIELLISSNAVVDAFRIQWRSMTLWRAARGCSAQTATLAICSSDVRVFRILANGKPVEWNASLRNSTIPIYSKTVYIFIPEKLTPVITLIAPSGCRPFNRRCVYTRSRCFLGVCSDWLWGWGRCRTRPCGVYTAYDPLRTALATLPNRKLISCRFCRIWSRCSDWPRMLQ